MEGAEIDKLATWRAAALQSVAGGVAGGAYGGLLAFLHQQPPAFLISAYGLNATLFTGAFLAVRATAVAALPSSASPVSVSAAAGGVTGALFTAVSGQATCGVGWAGERGGGVRNCRRQTALLR